MVRPAENIRKDLDALGEATAALAKDFGQIYATYLTVLGHAQRRQVIMATYHLCTQVYPEEFLALSVGDRARLQQEVQNLGRKGQSWLQQLMEPEPHDAESDSPRRFDRDDLNRLEVALGALAHPAEAAARGVNDGDSEAETEKTDEEAAEQPRDSTEPSPEDSAATPEGETPTAVAELDPKQLIQSVIMAAMASDISDREESIGGQPFVGDPLTPTLVAKHHLILERMIRDVLQRISKHANRLLRRAKILPDLPEALIEMASEADVGVPRGRSVPNVLSVMVAMSGDVAAEFEPRHADSDEDEGDDSEDEDEVMEANMTHLAAINLRLADLEFGDVQAALWRSKLRSSVGRLRKLGKQYQQAERELAIAEAEQAWRAVWSDESSR